MSPSLTIKFTPSLLEGLEAAASATHFAKEDLAKMAIHALVREFRETGTVTVRAKTEPRLALHSKTSRRMAELDKVLNINLSDGIAQTVLDGVVRDLIEGDDGLIFDGWQFKKPNHWKAKLVGLVAKWKSEDALTAVEAKEVAA